MLPMDINLNLNILIIKHFKKFYVFLLKNNNKKQLTIIQRPYIEKP